MGDSSFFCLCTTPSSIPPQRTSHHFSTPTPPTTTTITNDKASAIFTAVDDEKIKRRRQYHLVYVAYLRSTGLPFHPSLRPQYCLIPHNHSAFTTLQTPKGHRHPLKPTAPPTIVNK